MCGASAASVPLPSLSVLFVWVVLFWTLNAKDKRTRTSVILGVGVAVSALSWARAEHTLLQYQHNYHTTRALFTAPERCFGNGTVVSSPTFKTAHTPASADTTADQVALYTLRFTSLECESLTLPNAQLEGPLDVRVTGGPASLARGDQVELCAQLAPIQLFRNPLLPNSWLGAARNGAALSGSALNVEVIKSGTQFFSWMDRFRAHVRRRIQLTYTAATVPLGRALVLGESDLPGEDALAFRQSGLLHLLAVSGTHLVIFVLTLVRLLRAILIRVQLLARRYDVTRWSSGFGAVASLLYADFSGGSGSAWRAAYMLCMVCGGRALGLKVGGGTALGASLLLGLALDPLASSDFSFLLSALATSGLIGLGQPLTRWATRGEPPRWITRIGLEKPGRLLVESLCATLASTLPCASVLAMMDDQMTWAALFANVVAAPLGELIALPACLLHALVSPLDQLERGLALLGSGALYGVRTVALLSASLSFARFSVPFPRASAVAWGLSALLLVSTHASARLVLLGGRQSKLRTPASRGLALLVLAFVVGWAHPFAPQRPDVTAQAIAGAGVNTATPRGVSAPSSDASLSITALDVGQGDALFIEFPEGQVAVVDGGGYVTGTPDTGTRVVLPYLRSRGVAQLDLMVLSHAHPDHILGLITVAEKLRVKELWIPELESNALESNAPARSGYLAQLIHAVEARGGRVVPAEKLCDRIQMRGGAAIDVLAPCALLGTSLPESAGLNNRSLVLRIRYGEMNALLTGDIESTAEQMLLESRRSQLPAHLLKVAHHGSDTSSSLAFVEAVRPKVAFISSGVRNTFRHPRPSTLSTLNRLGVEVLRTDQQGSLSWSTDGKKATIRSFDPRPTPASPTPGSEI
jgi:competence protein ComEC